MPFFSVLIPSYNRPELIGETVESILKSDFRDYELIISDDKSPRQEEIQTVLKPYLHDSRVRLYLQRENLSEARNRDYLFHMASGQWLIVLGDDDKIYPNALSSIAAAIKEYPGAGVYVFGYTIIDEFGCERYSRRAPRALRISMAENPRLVREVIVSDCFPFWMYHPATFCADKRVHMEIKSRSDVGIGDDFMFMIDFINKGGVLQILPFVLMCYRKAHTSAKHIQLNLSSGEVPQLIARSKIMRQLLLRTDLHPSIVDFVASRHCRQRLLYDAILWSSLDIKSASERLELSAKMSEELASYAKPRPRVLYRKWLLCRRVLFFLDLFGLAGVQELKNLLAGRLKLSKNH